MIVGRTLKTCQVNFMRGGKKILILARAKRGMANSLTNKKKTHTHSCVFASYYVLSLHFSTNTQHTLTHIHTNNTTISAFYP